MHVCWINALISLKKIIYIPVYISLTPNIWTVVYYKKLHFTAIIWIYLNVVSFQLRFKYSHFQMWIQELNFKDILISVLNGPQTQFDTDMLSSVTSVSWEMCEDVVKYSEAVEQWSWTGARRLCKQKAFSCFSLRREFVYLKCSYTVCLLSRLHKASS